MAYTFDGVNRLIVLPSGSTTLDIADLYSRWKDWSVTDDNTKFVEAFRTTGGDPLTPGVTAGAYFFIRNDLGWRIRPAEEDATILVSGNLAPEDSSIPILVPTLGDFSVLLAGLQPVTQNVSELLELQQSTSYGGYVVLAPQEGFAGTSYPTGQHQRPVNNLTDALAICAANGVEVILLEGDHVLDQALPESFNIRGEAGTVGSSIDLNGQAVNKCTFTQLQVSGAGTGIVEMDLCSLDTVSGVTGVFRQCGFQNTFTFAAGNYVFAHCFSEIPGTAKPIFDYNGAAANASFRAYSGGFDMRNCTHASATTTIDVISASILLQSSCTAGAVVVRGVGDFTDNSTMTVKDIGFVLGGQLFTDVLDEPNSIEAGLTMREALRLILAATAGKVTGADTSTVTIRNAFADTKNRIVATVDTVGNRSSISYDVSD